MPAVSILNEHGGVLRTVQTDPHDEDRMVLVTEQDLDPVIRHVEMKREMRNGGRRHLDGLTEVGVIPAAFAEKMMREGSLFDEAAIRRFFNDPDHRDFRVYWGTI